MKEEDRSQSKHNDRNLNNELLNRNKNENKMDLELNIDNRNRYQTKRQLLHQSHDEIPSKQPNIPIQEMNVPIQKMKTYKTLPYNSGMMIEEVSIKPKGQFKEEILNGVDGGTVEMNKSSVKFSDQTFSSKHSKSSLTSNSSKKSMYLTPSDHGHSTSSPPLNHSNKHQLSIHDNMERLQPHNHIVRTVPLRSANTPLSGAWLHRGTVPRVENLNQNLVNDDAEEILLDLINIVVDALSRLDIDSLKIQEEEVLTLLSGSENSSISNIKFLMHTALIFKEQVKVKGLREKGSAQPHYSIQHIERYDLL
jgi:hypothetical protein